MRSDVVNQHDSGDGLQYEILTIKEAATYLRVSRVTAWRWCQQGIIPASRVGGSWRIRRADLLEIFDTAQPSCSASIRRIQPAKDDPDDDN